LPWWPECTHATHRPWVHHIQAFGFVNIEAEGALLKALQKLRDLLDDPLTQRMRDEETRGVFQGHKPSQEAKVPADDKGRQRRGWVAWGKEATRAKLKEFKYKPRTPDEEAHALVSRVSIYLLCWST
jgi:hypothetical protein